MATERITIVVEERGTRVVKRRLGEIGRTAGASAQGVNLLRGALGAIGAGLVIRKLVQTADAYRGIQNRLRLVTHGTEELNTVSERLLGISTRTRSSLEHNAALFYRVSLATREMGISQQEVLRFTESLNKAILISGANAQEARAGLIQLSQGMASGRLHGDELRSVLEQLPRIADVIGKRMGVTRGEMRKMGREGKITAKIIMNSFRDAHEELAEEFKHVMPTVAQSFQVLENSIIAYVGVLNEAKGPTTILGGLIRSLAADLDVFARIVGAAGLTAALLLAVGAMKMFTAAIIANPLGALILALTFLISLLVTFSDKIGVTNDGFATLRDLGTATLNRLLEVARIVVDFFVRDFSRTCEIVGGVFTDIDLSLAGFLLFGARTLDSFMGIWVGLFEAIKALWTNLGPMLIDLMTQAMNGLIGIVEGGIDSIVAVLDTLAHIISHVGLAISQSFTTLAEAGGAALAGEFTHAGTIASASVNAFTANMGIAFADLPGRLGRNFEENAETDLIPRLENVAEGAAAKTGRAMLAGLVTGWESSTLLQDSVEALFAEAELASIKRRRELAQQTTGVDLAAAPAGGGAPLPLDPARVIKPILEGLRKQQELLRLTNGQREIQNELLKMRNRLEKENTKLTQEQWQQIEQELQRIQMLEQVASALEKVRGAEYNLVAIQQELNAQIANGTITLAQAQQAYTNLRLEMLETSTTASAGFERGLIKIGQTIDDFGTQAEDTLVNTFNSAEDALVQFVQTGEFSFSSLVDSILADLTRLLARQALSGLLGALGGGGGAGGLIAGLFSNAASRQGGGPVRPGGLYEVNEQGRELFVPSVPGNIVPAGQTAAMAGAATAPQVNVNITNVTDPNEIAAALTTPDGEKAILNVISRNKRALKGIS